MDILVHFFSFFIHLDQHMSEFVAHYGTWTYLLFFMIIFCETGLVVTPFLPGDSLLFVAGTLAALGSLELKWLLGLLIAAAILGNMLNYSVGRLLAQKVLRKDHIHFVKPQHIERTHEFFEKYGGKAIIITRFVPIIRSFAPFLAGAGAMSYRKFFIYNVLGALLWVLPFSLAGYFFGNIPAVKKQFTLVVFAIILISLLPVIFEYYQHKKSSAPNKPKGG